jgi:hypothetical protein
VRGASPTNPVFGLVQSGYAIDGGIERDAAVLLRQAEAMAMTNKVWYYWSADTVKKQITEPQMNTDEHGLGPSH